MNTQRVEGHTPTPWTKIGSAKRTLFTTAQGQQKVEPDKAFLPVEILTCLRHAEQAQADCDFVLYACNNIERLEKERAALILSLENSEKVNEALVRALEAERDNCVNCSGDGFYIHTSPGCEPESRECERCFSTRRALSLAKEPA